MSLEKRLQRLEWSLDVQRHSGDCGMGRELSHVPGQALPWCGEHGSGCWMRIPPETVASAARVLVDIGQASTLSQAIENLGGLYIPSLPGWRPPIEEAKAILGMEE